MKKVAVVGLMLALAAPMALAQTSKTALKTEMAPIQVNWEYNPPEIGHYESLPTEQKILFLSIVFSMPKVAPTGKTRGIHGKSILSKEVLEGLTIQDTQNVLDTLWAWKTFTKKVSQMTQEDSAKILQSCSGIYEQLAKDFAKNENTDEAFVAKNPTLVAFIAQEFKKPIAVGWEEGKTIVISDYIAQHLPNLTEHEAQPLVTFNRDVLSYKAPVDPEPTEDEKDGEGPSAPTASVHSEGYIIPAER